MEKITLHNYEAFYLDFLEGNLSEHEQTMLELFLADHPECKVNFDEIQILPVKKEEQLSDFDKQLLKQTDFNLLTVSNSTIEVLLIAKTENLLNPNKIKEVDAFLARNTDLQKIERELSATQLKADLGIVYEDKKHLKKERKIIPMWSIVASIAAIFILFFTLNFETNNEADQLAVVKPTSKNQVKKGDKIDFTNQSTSSQQKISYSISNQGNSSKKEIVSLDLKKINLPNSIDINDLEIEKSDIRRSVQKLTPSNSTVTMYGMNEMENPIQPITKQLSHLTKKEVDFKISKPKTKGRKSFYLKIGKIEISRKGH
ncbi:MAG: hypothetical protein LW701_00780 [Fluviicola sp.]|nr:hypothetical protein [Fluviicola sp.]